MFYVMLFIIADKSLFDGLKTGFKPFLALNITYIDTIVYILLLEISPCRFFLEKHTNTVIF